jgi:hypothetical protein
VHDDDVDPDELQEQDVTNEALLQRRVDHRAAAVLDHERAPMEAPDVRQCFLQHLGLLNQLFHICSQAPGRGKTASILAKE